MTMTLDERALTILAHELRHPLTPIRNAVALMRRLDLQEPSLAWICQVLDRQSL